MRALVLAFVLPLACTPRAPIRRHTETFVLASRALGEDRRINVYMPEGAGTETTILYMLDGGEAEDFPHVVATVETAVRAGEMAPVYVVGVENTERRRDTTPPTTIASDRQIAPHVGGSAAFRAFFRDELMPAMRARLHTRGRTAIIGESLAGLFVIDTFLAEPDTFDTYVALSPSLWWNDRALVKEAPAFCAKHPRIDRTLYVTIAGDDDRDDAVQGFADSMRRESPAGLTWIYEPRPEATHATIYAASEGPVLRRLFPPATTR